MKQKRFKETQIINILKEQETGCKVKDICRRYEMSQATFYNWKSKYGGMDVSDAKRLRELETKNIKLKRLLAEAMLDNVAPKCQSALNFDPLSASSLTPL